MSFSQKKSNYILVCLNNRTTSCWDKWLFNSIQHHGPNLEGCAQLGAPHYKKDLYWMSSAMVTGVIRWEKRVTYEKRLKEWGLFSLGKRRGKGDLLSAARWEAMDTSCSVPSDFREKKKHQYKGGPKSPTLEIIITQLGKAMSNLELPWEGI